MAALHLQAPICCIIVKDRYLGIAAHRLLDLAAMPESILKVLSERLSMSVRGNPFARVDLDKQQENAEQVGQGRDQEFFAVAP